MTLRPFHLAILTHDLEEARRFYGGLLGCEQGRSDAGWIDWSLDGHQLVTHLAPRAAIGGGRTPVVDGHGVPVPHFGLVLTMERWRALAERLREADVEFVLQPQVRFAGKPGEQATMFLRDPSGNALEFKAFADDAQLFAR